MGLIDYIDREKATKTILQDWNDQHWKYDNNRDQITEATARLTSATSRPDKLNIKGGSDTGSMIAAVIDRKAVLEHGYKLASEYITDLQPCWERLAEDEKFMLVARFVDRNEARGIETIMAKYNVGKTEAYDRSNAALKRLAKLIFW